MFELKKIGFVRRASAWLLDLILLAVLATGVMWIVSLICNYDEEEALASEYHTAWEDFRKEYAEGVAAYYGFTYEELDEEGNEYVITKDGQPATLQDVIEKLVRSEGADGGTAEAYAQYLLLPPVATVNAQYQYIYTMLFMMVSVGLLLAFLLLEFVLPIVFKNGQTVGKKVFGVGLVRPDCVKAPNLSLFARVVLGKYAIETMFPVLLLFLLLSGGIGWLAIVLFAALAILNIVLFFATKNHTPIHDIVAVTVAVDLRLQMVYETEEELNEKKALLQREAALQTKEQQ